MGISDFLSKIKEKKSFIEGSQSNLPVGSQGETLSEVFDRFLNPVNSRQLSTLNSEQLGILAILDSYAFADDEWDVDTFLLRLTENAFLLSSSINGNRGNQLQNIAVGQMNRNFALELAEIKSGEGNKELKDAI